MIKTLFSVGLSFFFISCSSESAINSVEDSSEEAIIDNNEQIEPSNIELQEPTYSSEAFYLEDTGWGYKIFKEGKLYINQPHIPAVSGIKGFETEDDALRTANFAIYKIESGFVPPTISVEELDSLGVLK